MALEVCLCTSVCATCLCLCGDMRDWMTQGRVSVYWCHVCALPQSINLCASARQFVCLPTGEHVCTRVVLRVLGGMQHGVGPSSHIPYLPLPTRLAGLMTACARPCISQVSCHLSVAAILEGEAADWWAGVFTRPQQAGALQAHSGHTPPLPFAA